VKKWTLIAVIISSCLFSTAHAETWQQVTKTPDNVVFYSDSDHLDIIKGNLNHEKTDVVKRTTENPKRVWIKIQNPTPDANQGNLLYYKILLECDFKTEKLRIIYIGAYDNADQYLGNSHTPDSDWQPLDPTSPIGQLGLHAEKYLNIK